MAQQWMTVCPRLLRTGLPHTYGPSIIINSIPFRLKSASLWTLDDLVP